MKEDELVTVTKESIELDFRKEELESAKQDRAERKKYAFYIFWFLCSFLLIVLAIVIFITFKNNGLDNSVLITLMTTTSADIIGLFIIVVTYLFNTK
jgi:hypothetical protein